MFEIERFHPNRRFMTFKTELHSEAQLVYGLAGGRAGGGRKNVYEKQYVLLKSEHNRRLLHCKTSFFFKDIILNNFFITKDEITIL